MRDLKHKGSVVPALLVAGFATQAWGETTDATQDIQEVVVTAQKVSQRQIDVPVAVSVVQSDALTNQDLNQVADYYSRIPGLQLGGDPGNSNGIAALSLRGITTGGDGNPTVGILVDDVPFGATTNFGQPPFPDFDPGVLDHVEVLRGPQGTLYGASSLGGLIKFVTRDPDTNNWLGNIEAGPSWTHGGDDGWNVRGSLNIPVISDHVGLLLSGFYRDDPGWLTNIYPNAAQRDDVNATESRGGNAKLLIKPVDNLSITFSALAQHKDFGYASDIMVCPQCNTNLSTPPNYTPIYGQDTVSLGPTGGWSTFELFSGRIEYNFGWAQLTSVSAWNHSHWFDNEDVTSVFYFLPPLYNLPGGRVAIANENESGKFTQEIRLGSVGKQFDWLVGLYFNHETENLIQALDLYSANGASQGQPYDGFGPFYYTERALFADFTYHFTPEFDLQVGGRYSDLSESYYSSTVITGAAQGPFGPTTTIPTNSSSAHPATWLVTPSYHFTPDIMAYLRASSGYRPGGPNTGVPGVPPTYAPDKVTSYELGLKADLTKEHRISFDVAAFQIDWNNIQLPDTDPLNDFTYFSNGSAARSRGIELDFTWRPWTGLTVSPNFTYTDAVLTQNLPPPSAAVTPLAGLAGDPLPYTAKNAGNLLLQQDFVISRDLAAYASANYSYTGMRWSAFRTNSTDAPGPRFVLPGYGLLDLQGGFIWKDDWRLNIFARNVTDKRGIINATSRNGTVAPEAYFTQPLTVGFNVAYSFRGTGTSR